mmetsp:Transcript_8250/g.25533  ORF Transcript_8250/g.25533 Transcript_8250/m.25533 type:complete len:203 (-) Transcript_8250:2769-3377(-)
MLHRRQVAEVALGAKRVQQRHVEEERVDQGRDDRRENQNAHLREERELAREQEDCGAGRRDGPGEHCRAHRCHRKDELVFACVQLLLVPASIEHVPQVNAVVDAEADDDDARDGLLDAKSPPEHPSEAENRGDDESNRDDGKRSEDEVLCRGDKREESHGEGDRHADEEAVDQRPLGLEPDPRVRELPDLRQSGVAHVTAVP